MKIEEAIKQKKFNSSKHKAIVNLFYTYHAICDMHAGLFKKFDITSQQYNVLRILRGKHPDAIIVGYVKEVMLDKNPDLTRLCDRLLNKGYIVRNLNESNRRQVLIKITDKGLNLLKTIDPMVKQEEEKINLTEKEAAFIAISENNYVKHVEEYLAR